MLIDQLHPKWRDLLSNQLPFLQGVETRISGGEQTVPAHQHILRALSWSPDDQRVLLLGQDPYPNPEHAIGLCFAIPQTAKPVPGSLRNILAELATDLDAEVPANLSLSKWAEAGVLMLNRHLTSAPGEIAAHLDWGWERFTDAVISNWIEYRREQAVAILWGKQARSVMPLLKSLPVIQSAHPSPLSARRGFFGSRPFSRCNLELTKLQLSTIDWI
jgi:uracil-DNA glycosylase